MNRQEVAVSRTPLRIALFTGNFNYTRDGAAQALGRLVEHLRAVAGVVEVAREQGDAKGRATHGDLLAVHELNSTAPASEL